MATLSAYLYNNSIPFQSEVNDFAGWAGDLITVNIEVNQNKDNSQYSGDVYKCALDIIASKNIESHFNFSDFAGDLDALNIYGLLEDNRTIFNVVQEYYKTPVRNRASLFYKTRFSSDSDTLNEEAKRYMLSIEPQVNYLRTSLQSNFDVPAWSYEEGEQIAEAFATVLLNAVNKENI